MDKQLHIDIDELEARIRKMNASLEQQARTAATDARSALLIDMQVEGMELFIAAHRLIAKWGNECKPVNLQAQAFGNLVGMLAGAFLARHPSRLSLFSAYFDQAVQVSQTGIAPKGAVSSSNAVPIMPTGSA
ncbi:hypothetical protein [Ferrovibrio sp.]|uniref:hypothetical protein n=1 Tax=Ferrovibrio sp. TaxID=1917215 RepID=UPI0035AD8FF7